MRSRRSTSHLASFAASAVTLVALLSAAPLSASAAGAADAEPASGLTTVWAEFEVPKNTKQSFVLSCPASHPWLKRYLPGTTLKNELAPDRPGNPGGLRVTAEPVIAFEWLQAYAENRVESGGQNWRAYKAVIARAHTYNPFGSERFALEIQCVADPVDGAGDDPRPL